MAPSYKLTYFNFRGLAEPIRFLLKYGKLDFEDNRIDYEEWPKIKDTMPFGQMPVLEHNGKKITQSLAICRYLGKELKLAGNNSWEGMEIDAIVDAMNDLRQKIISAAFFEKDEKLKAEKLKVAIDETLPYYYKKFDAIAKQNKGHLALGKLTWADFIFAASIDTFNTICKKDILADYPNLKQVQSNVLANPEIKKWVATRPKTEY